MRTVKHGAIAVLLAVACFGCVTTDKAVTLPGGEKGYSVSCGDTKSWDSCFSKANDLCGSGYEIVSRETEGLASHSEAKFGEVKYPHAERILIVKCIQ